MIEKYQESILTIVDREVGALRSVVETRFDGMDEAVKIFHDDLTRVPTQLQLAITGLRELLEAELLCAKNVNAARCDGFSRRLDTMENRRVELKSDSQRQIDQALASQEKLFQLSVESSREAAGKSENAFTKQIDALAKQMLAADDALSARINVLKESTDTGRGKEMHQSETRQMAGWVLPMIITVIVNFLALAVTIIIATIGTTP